MSDTALAPGTAIDLTNCDREPIHLLGAVQPIGALIALSADWMVSRVSANIGEFFNTTPGDLIGRPASIIFSGDAIHAMRNRLALLRSPDSMERIFRCDLTGDERYFDVALHMSKGSVLLELEPSTERNYGDATGTVRGMISRLDQSVDFNRFLAEGARQVRALTGFDRVMIYRFDQDKSGEVIAEAAKSGIGSFMGLHYPASDIPVQARELYKRSLIRMITDIDASPVRMIPELDEYKRPLDLSLAVLRSVSPIHVEYLRNMGVRASMSISIVVDGELWGLFACHHYSPRCPSFERRSVCELFSQMFSMRLESRERKATVDFERHARDLSDQLLSAVASDESLLNDPEWLSSILMSAIPADGVGVWINGNYAFSGQTPDTRSFAQIVRALGGTAAGKVFATACIGDVVPDAKSFASQSAGMLAIPISRTPRDYVILFRAEKVRSVRWAGDPHKPAEFGPNGPRLSPRKSFDEWKQLVEGHSEPFSNSEVRVAETLRATLIEVVLRLADEASIERRAAGERQELLIAELNHRVRNILSLIRGLIRQSKPGEGVSIEQFVDLIDGRVHALARAHNQITDDHWGPAPLRSLIDAELAAYLSLERQRVTIEGPPLNLNPQAYSTMALVIHELVTNSAKYGGLSTAGGNVLLAWRRDNTGDLLFVWRESGGPVVVPPKRKGFGSTIIENSVPYDLGGKSDIHFDPEGFNAAFRIPARHVVDPPPSASAFDKLPRMETPPSPRPIAAGDADPNLLAGKRVLLVEDSLIIALDADDILRRLGAADVITDGTVAGALNVLSNDPPDIAILDINLGDHNSFAIADKLLELGIPFMFATGYGEQARLPDQHRPRIVLQKPYTLATMIRRLPEILELVLAK